MRSSLLALVRWHWGIENRLPNVVEARRYFTAHLHQAAQLILVLNPTLHQPCVKEYAWLTFCVC